MAHTQTTDDQAQPGVTVRDNLAECSVDGALLQVTEDTQAGVALWCWKCRRTYRVTVPAGPLARVMDVHRRMVQGDHKDGGPTQRRDRVDGRNLEPDPGVFKGF